MKKKIIRVDIDNTICQTDDRGYESSVPIYPIINKVNVLYEKGHTIIYWTARGAVTGLDWRELTEIQLKSWGCKYHELHLDKPFYDLFIEDRSCLPIDVGKL